ncbi:hypothetical protein SUGI_0566260 [Cryptomeria japonica]|nr:hypothetical protein SUGI_0566260 [Cryptomeria japonica]
MEIKLEMPLILTSQKTIDARGSNLHIRNGPCIILLNGNNVIIHGLNIHNCQPSKSGMIFLAEGTQAEEIETQDGDDISVSYFPDVWIDHNTLFNCSDRLVHVTLPSTADTISNNRFSYHDMVMLLGHSDDYRADKAMKVTVAFNHFGPGLIERMPRCRHGYVHVANNNYEPWRIYLIPLLLMEHTSSHLANQKHFPIMTLNRVSKFSQEHLCLQYSPRPREPYLAL